MSRRHPCDAHLGNIDAAFELFGLTIGQTTDTFVPDATVRRDQMATFLIRLLDVTVLTDDAATQGVVGQVTDVVPDAITQVVEDADVVDEGLLGRTLP